MRSLRKFDTVAAMVSNAEISWARLFDLLNTMDSMFEMEALPQEELHRLKSLVWEITAVNGGFDATKQGTDFKDPVGGALAEHAFSVVARELLGGDAPDSWKLLIEGINEVNPRPNRGRNRP